MGAFEPRSFPPKLLDRMAADLRAGAIAFGALHRGEPVALMFAFLGKTDTIYGTLPLAGDEAYLAEMHTRVPFRGRNLAPHLRHHAYVALAGMGKTRLYSVSNAFNAQSIRFKEKLDARFLWLGMRIALFGRAGRVVKLRTYRG
jgi:hypothetical protein